MRDEWTVVGREYGVPHNIAAARAATTSCIGFAREPTRGRRLAGANVIIDDMAALAVEMESSPVG